MANHRHLLLALVVLLYAAPLFAQTPQSCDGLKSLSLANASVTTAAVVTGSFTPPGADQPECHDCESPDVLPRRGTLKPTPTPTSRLSSGCR